MPISPQDVQKYVEDSYDLGKIYANIDAFLKRGGMQKVHSVSIALVPSGVADKIALAYTSVGWKVNYVQVYDQRDGDCTNFCFTTV